MFWYQDDIKRLQEERNARNSNNGVVFYGSSTIRLWNSLQQDFEGFQPINAGFGGSTLAACVWYFNQVIAPLQPTSFIIYAGDNDLGDNRHPEEVFIFFKQLIALIHENFGDISVSYISIKPSPNRWSIVEQIKFTNKIIKAEIEKMNCNVHFIDIFDKMIDENGFPKREFFMPDGLHINPKGYNLWRDIILNEAERIHLRLFATENK